MSSAISFNLDQCKILSSGNGLKKNHYQMETMSFFKKYIQTQIYTLTKTKTASFPNTEFTSKINLYTTAPGISFQQKSAS